MLCIKVFMHQYTNSPRSLQCKRRTAYTISSAQNTVTQVPRVLRHSSMTPIPNSIRRVVRRSMDVRKPYELTAEQLALAKARREKKKKAQALQTSVKTPPTTLLHRPWLNISHAESSKNPGSGCKILTWNVCGTLSFSTPGQLK